MLSLQGIIDLLNDNGRKPPPELKRWKDVYYGMSLHIDGACPAFQYLRDNGWSEVRPKNYFGAEYQIIFNTYLFNRHPREPEVTRQWRLSQYKPFTQAPFLQVIQVITGAIFQDSGYALNMDNKDDNDFIWGNNFDGKSLAGYVSDKFQMIAADPNGVFVVIPDSPYYDTKSKKVQPSCWFVGSKDILWTTPDELIFCRDEFTWVVNKVGYFRFVKGKDGKYVNYDGPNNGYYTHFLERLPVHIGGGQKNNQGFYESHLNAAKAVADEYVSGKSAAQLVNKEASHPWIIEASEDCPDCSGVGQRTIDCDACPDGKELVQCSRCHGSGEISHNPGDHLIAPKEDMQHQLVQVVSPNIGINTFHKDSNKEIYNDMLKALHLSYIEEAQSGVAKDKDMETRYQFIVSISNDLFDRLIPGLMVDITALRNVTVSNGTTKPASGTYTIVKPTQFQIKTAADLLAEYDAATKAMVPDYMKARQLEDYVDKQFGGDDVLKKKTWLINQIDVFAVSTMGDIQSALLAGVDHLEFQRHIWLPKLIDQVVRDKSKEWFLNSPFDVINAELETLFNALVPPVVILPPNAIPA